MKSWAGFITINRRVMMVIMAGILIGAVAAVPGCKKDKEIEPEAAGTPQKALPGEAGFTYKIIVKDMSLNWRTAGNTLQAMIRAKTSGWVGVGFNSTEVMKDAWFIMGYVRDGKVTISEQHGNTPRTHLRKTDLGGKETVTGASGTEDNNGTEIRFTIPLIPGDIDKPIAAAGDTLVSLAYGKTEQLAQLHAFRAKIKVNLSTGAYSVITVK